MPTKKDRHTAVSFPWWAIEDSAERQRSVRKQPSGYFLTKPAEERRPPIFLGRAVAIPLTIFALAKMRGENHAGK